MSRYTTPAIEIARSALDRGGMVKSGSHWAYIKRGRGRRPVTRLFNAVTIHSLLQSGEAVVRGKRCVKNG